MYHNGIFNHGNLVAKKIKAIKDNKSHGVDGIPPKLLMETVERISVPLIGCSTCY